MLHTFVSLVLSFAARGQSSSQWVEQCLGISTVEKCKFGKWHAVSQVLSTVSQLVSRVVRGGLVEQCRWTNQMVMQHLNSWSVMWTK